MLVIHLNRCFCSCLRLEPLTQSAFLTFVSFNLFVFQFSARTPTSAFVAIHHRVAVVVLRFVLRESACNEDTIVSASGHRVFMSAATERDCFSIGFVLP